MIEYLKGVLVEISPTCAVIETPGGVAYSANISLVSYDSLAGSIGQQVKLLTCLIVREDAQLLYGFVTPQERELFILLIGVSGVGANTARLILSAAPPSELNVIINSGDVKRLKAVKGIGSKTAERIIVDLRDKIKPDLSTLSIQNVLRSDVADEALAALVALGFNKAAALKVLDKVFAANPGITVERAIKSAFTML